MSITIVSNLYETGFVDVTFNLITEKFFSFRKLNNKLFYVNAKTIHPPTIMRYNLSCNEEEYEKAKPLYETTLNESEHKTRKYYMI